jgi:hypothetical protein
VDSEVRIRFPELVVVVIATSFIFCTVIGGREAMTITVVYESKRIEKMRT